MRSTQSKVWLVAAITMATIAEAQVPITFAMRKLAFSTNQFGIDLYRALRVPDTDGVAFCPFCIGSSLAMALLGAQGRTANALHQALYLWGLRPNDVHLAFHDLNLHLRENLRAVTSHDHLGDRAFRQEQDPDFEVILFNNMYVQRDYSILYPFQRFLHQYYNSTINPLDFGMYEEESRQHINAIVEKKTQGKIRNILMHPLPRSTSLLMLNALAFDGVLDPNSTPTSAQTASAPGGYDRYRPPYGYQGTYGRPAPFQSNQLPPTTARKADLRYGQFDYLSCTGIEVPFRSGVLSFVILLPNEHGGIALLENRLNAQHLNDILNTMQSKHVILEMPHIALEDSQKNLTQALFRTGLVDLFTPGYAELFGISDYRWLHVTNIVHKVNINIREGSRIHSSPAGGEMIHLTLDKPFLFFIVDNMSGLVLAMGKVVTTRS